VGETKKRPIVMSKLFTIKTLRSWYATDSQRKENISLMIQFFYVVIIGLCICIAWKQKLEIQQYIVVGAAILIYFWYMTIMVLSILRYMLPAMGLFFVLLPAIFKKFIAGHPIE
jgi:hypothetical protein